jgi:hypothetical protein
MQNPNKRLLVSVRRWLVAGLAALLFGCGEDDPTALGRGTRLPPGPLFDTTLAVVRTDSVFPIPIALGRSPVGQLGFELAYTAHLLFAYSVPTLVVRDGDSLRLDTATLIVRTDSLLLAPFSGRVRIGVQEVAVAERGWSPDSAISVLPLLEPDALAPDTLLADSTLVGHSNQLEFALNLNRIAGYDTVRTAGTALEVHLAVVFRGFDPSGGRGFLEVRLRDDNSNPTTQLIGFSNEDAAAIATVLPVKQTPVVLYDTNYNPGTNLVLSDGFRQHTFLRFAPLTSALPESALVHRAELRLNQVHTTAGTSFGASQALGVIVPDDTTTIFSRATNNRAFGFSATLTTFPGIEVPIVVTSYIFDIREGTVPDRGMILRLSNEGTKARHFEFYGGAAADSLRPRLHIIYSMPAGFEGER